jgi:hypothetical protein
MSFEAKRSRHVTVAIPQVSISRGIAVSPRQDVFAPGRPRQYRAIARIVKAAANGDPKRRSPLDGSPSARPITLCDHRSTSADSALSILAKIAAIDSPTIKVASPTDSMRAMASDASRDASRTRS